jgi:hypothetical protein
MYVGISLPRQDCQQAQEAGFLLNRMLVLTDVLAGGLKKNRNSALPHTIAQVCLHVKYLP